MRVNAVVIDEFLDDPDYVRTVALNSEYPITGNFPGKRTYQCDENYNTEIKNKIENILKIKIVEWNKHFDNNTDKIIDVDTSCFQLCLHDATTWIHQDPNEYTAILYLTPDAPVDSGTGIYMHKKTGIYRHIESHQIDYIDINNWQLIIFSGNVYNRLFIFRGDLYHRSVVPGFGVDKYTGRLTQTFFFNSEEYKKMGNKNE